MIDDINSFAEPKLSKEGQIGGTAWKAMDANTKCSYVSYTPYIGNGFKKPVIANKLKYEGVTCVNDFETMRVQKISQFVFKAWLNGKLVKRFRVKLRRGTTTFNLKFKSGLLLGTVKMDFIKFYK